MAYTTRLTPRTTIQTGTPLLLLSRRPPPNSAPYCAPRVSMPATMPAVEAMVITVTSRWATWLSSWASTASISSAVSSPRMPVVTQTTDRSGERPVAKALGTDMSATPTRGLGMSARATSRSIMAWSSGASSGVTSRARIAFIATVSEKYHCPHAIPRPMIPMIGAYCTGMTNMSTTTRATNTAPSRNITDVIRTVRPESGAKRVRAMYPVSTRDQTVAAEHVAYLRQGGVRHRQDQVAR